MPPRIGRLPEKSATRHSTSLVVMMELNAGGRVSQQPEKDVGLFGFKMLSNLTRQQSQPDQSLEQSARGADTWRDRSADRAYREAFD